MAFTVISSRRDDNGWIRRIGEIHPLTRELMRVVTASREDRDL